MEKISIVEIIVAMLASAPGLYGLWLQRKKNKAEADKVEKEAKQADSAAADAIADTALSLVTPLREENTRIKYQLEECEKGALECKRAKRKLQRELEELWKGTAYLVNQVKNLGETPVYDLPPYPENGGPPTKPLPKEKE